MAPVAQRIQVNPNDPTQSMILWSSGRIVARGGALDPMLVSGTPPVVSNPSDATGPWRAFQVIDWTEPSGYSMDYYGNVACWGPSGSVPAAPSPPAPPITPFKIAVDFAMNPNGTGEGYRLTMAGAVEGMGGAPAIAAGPTFPGNSAKRLTMEYSSKKYYVLEQQGGTYARDGALNLINGPGWPGYDAARALEITDWGAGKGYLLELQGGVYALGVGTQVAAGGPVWPGQNFAKDLRVIDDGTDPDLPLRLVILDASGGVYQFVSSLPPRLAPVAGQPADPTTTTTKPRVSWTYVDPENDAQVFAEFVVYRDADTTAFVTESQQVTVVGSPTGGTFRLRFGGETTGTIARNASPSTVAAALNALNVGGSFACTGTLAAGMIVTFDAAGSTLLDRAAQPMLARVGVALTGGTSPAVVITRVAAGTDPFSFPPPAATVMAAVTTDPARRFFDLDRDLENGDYRAFVHATDDAGIWSPTISIPWTQDVVIPPTPVLDVQDLGGLRGIRITPTFTSPPAHAKFMVEWSDDFEGDPDGATWQEVRYFAAGDPTDSGPVITTPIVDATWADTGVSWADSSIPWGGGATDVDPGGPVNPDSIVDYEARFGVPRWYRARVYTENPYLSSESSVPVQATLSGGTWCVVPIDNPDLGMAVSVVPPFDFDQEAAGGAQWGAGARFPIISRDGAPRSNTATLKIRVNNIEQNAALKNILDLAQTVLIRNSWGEGWYASMLGTLHGTHPLAGSKKSEQLRGFQTSFVRELDLPMTQEARPPVSQPDPFADLTPA